MSARITGATALALSTVLMLSACSGSEPPAGDPAPSDSSAAEETTSAAPELQSFDSPTAFDGDVVEVTLDAWTMNQGGGFSSQFTLSGQVAYGTTATGVGAVDLATGETLWETTFPNAPAEPSDSFLFDEDDPLGPVLSEDGSTLYSAMVVNVVGTGTTQDSVAVEVIAVDTETGELTWSVDTTETERIFDASLENAIVVAVQDGQAIVTRVADNGMGSVSAIDLDTQEVLWTQAGVARVVTSDVVVAVVSDILAEPYVVGIDPATGDVLWGSADDPAFAADDVHGIETGAGLVMTFDAVVNSWTNIEARTGIVNPSTGVFESTLDGVVLGDMIRSGDTIYSYGNDTLAAFDAATFTPMWSLPEGNRIAPTQPTYFGGLVYGGVGNDRSVVLDGVTGQDVSVNVSGVIFAVNEYGALTELADRLLFIYATAGADA